MKSRVVAFMLWVATTTLALCAIAANDSASAKTQQNPPNAEPPVVRAQTALASPVVFPPWRASLPAAHRVHAEKTTLRCVDCHSFATSSNTSQDWLGPSRDRCTECHGQRFANVPATSAPIPRLRFAHQRHAATGLGCEACHAHVNEREDAVGAERMPLMAACLRCHSSNRAAQRKASGDCRLCHVSRGGVIQTRSKEGLLVPSKSLGSIDHSGNWLYRHAEAAMNQGTVCSKCHKDTDCFACHNSALRPRSIHPSDWISLHGIQARQEGGSCVSCHRSQSECLTCHLRAGVSPSGPRALEAARGRFHPPPSVWTDRPRTGRHHAVQARLHLDECVSCHQERDCAACHATASVGGPGLGARYGRGMSPHPPDFGSQCRGIFGKNPRPCLVCHRADDPGLLRCL